MQVIRCLGSPLHSLQHMKAVIVQLTARNLYARGRDHDTAVRPSVSYPAMHSARAFA